MFKVDTQKIYQLLVQVQAEMRAGFGEVDIKLVSLEQKLTNRIDNLEEKVDDIEVNLKQVRLTQLEDSRAINSVLMRHDRDIKSLKRWRTKCAAQ